MPSCVIRYCGNYTNKTSKTAGITYHSFPVDELRRLKWIDFVRKDRKQSYWEPSNSSRICSNHFKDEDKYTSGRGLTLLKKSALPIAAPALENPDCSLTHDTLTTSPNSLHEENISDLEYVFDTPLESALKSRVQKLSRDKQKLIKINSNFKKKIKRLRMKTDSMNKILKHLKKQVDYYKKQKPQLHCVCQKSS